MIEALELELARDWFETVLGNLEQAGRIVEGGWPGTLSDARRLLVKRLAALSTALPKSDLDRSAKAIYRDAKRRWLDIATRYPSPTSG